MTADFLPSLHDSDLDQALRRAKSSMRQGDWVRAEQLYRAALTASPDHPEALEGLGIVALQTQRAAEALTWLTRAHAHDPNHVGLLSNLGVAQGRTGRLQEALASYRRARELAPDDPRVLINLARSEREVGQLPSALEHFRQALLLRPDSPDILSMLSNALREAGQLEESLESARRAAQKNPWLGEAHINEGAALHLSGRPSEAAVAYFAASALPATRTAALGNLQLALSELAAGQEDPRGEVDLVRRASSGRIARPELGGLLLTLARRVAEGPSYWQAIVVFEHALELCPDATGGRELALLLWEHGHESRAISRLVWALECEPNHTWGFRVLGDWLAKLDPNRHRCTRWKALLDRCPNDLQSLVNLGAATQRRGFAVEAARLHRRAIGLDPLCLEAHLNLGSALSDQGLAEEAAAVYRTALEVAPQSWPIHSNFLFSLHLDPTQTPQSIFDAHQRFGQALQASVRAEIVQHPHDRNPERPLRIGYVSPDFRNHPVAHFIEPILRSHDRSQVSVHCYSDVEHPDAVTARLRELADTFTPCVGWRHAQLAQRLRADRIDILVDLAGHTARNRLPTFARRPSPVQVSWLGYFDTTGLTSIDYRLADIHSVKAGEDSLFTETLVRLPRSANCYQAPPSPLPAPAPHLASGHITFGCFNNPMKVGREVVGVFSRILRAVPNSQLLLKYTAFADPHRRAQYLGWFSEDGIAEGRIRFEGPSALSDFMESFSQLDIALDPFPYSGETTALHTLWMGVPLVVLEGPSLVQRLASRVLSVCGRREWVASTQDDYVRVAVDLARDRNYLATIRGRLREELEGSPLLDHAGITHDVETAYRAMWRQWCHHGSTGRA